MDRFKTVGVPLLMWGGPFLVFRFVADFTTIQSMVLTLLAALTLTTSRFVVKVGLRNPPEFDPFWVVIVPNWEALGREYGICDSRKVNDVVAAIPENRRRESIVASGLAFTVLTPKLVYSGTYGAFSSTPDWRIHLEEFRGSSEFMDWPVFYIRRSRPGKGKDQTLAFELGLERPSQLHESAHRNPSTPIAYVPEILFYPFSHRDAYWNGGEYAKITDRIRREVERFGWKWASYTSGRERLEHEYFVVEYGGID